MFPFDKDTLTPQFIWKTSNKPSDPIPGNRGVNARDDAHYFGACALQILSLAKRPVYPDRSIAMRQVLYEEVEVGLSCLRFGAVLREEKKTGHSA